MKDNMNDDSDEWDENRLEDSKMNRKWDKR